MRHLILLLSATVLCAADPVGHWRFGLGSVDGQPARIGTIVLTGQQVVAATTAPLRLVCHEAPGITTILAPGSTGRFLVEGQADARTLVLELESGVAQLDITDRAPYAAVRVRGAALDVRVTGTLFVVERTRRDADYIALVRGKVVVGLRPEVAKALGKAGEIELLERQGMAADTANGLGSPSEMSTRPQVTAMAPLSEQASGQGTDWDIDLGAELTGALLENNGLGDVPGPADELAGGTPFSEVAEELVDSMAELGAPPESSGDTASEIAGGSTSGAPPLLPGPPSPP